MIKSIHYIVATIFLSILVGNNGNVLSNNSKGHLIIIGGGNRPDYMMEKIFELAGGNNANFLIIPNASSDPVETGKYYMEQFSESGMKKVDYLALTPETVDASESLEKMVGVTGVFFSGGDQSRLTDLMTGTKLLEVLRTLYKEGAVISGTSAGAAIMSEIMITGNELISLDTTYAFGSIQAGNIEHVPGFALVDEAIIDQHHIRRMRHNRLISLVMENPHLIGIGIDEGTAIWVKPNRSCEVIGESAVLIYDAREAEITKAKNGQFHCRGMKFDILLHGDTFNLTSAEYFE